MTTILRTVLSSVAALLAGCTVSSPDWRGIVCHRAEGAIERIRTGRPDAADPRLQAVSVDQAGDVALVHFDAAGPRSEVLHRNGTELTGLTIADVDPAIVGQEIYVGGYLPGKAGEENGGMVLQISIASGSPRVRVRRLWTGDAYVHSVEPLPGPAGDAPVGLLVTTYAGAVHELLPRDGEWHDRLLHAEPPSRDPEANKIKDAAFLLDARGRRSRVALVAFKTGRLLRIDVDRPDAARVLLEEPGGLSRITPDPEGGAFVTGYAGRLLHLTPRGEAFDVRVLDEEGADSGLRGAVLGTFPVGRETASIAIFGFHRLCRALVRRDGGLVPVTVFVDVDRGHTIEAADLVPDNGADELLVGGYSKCVTMLVPATPGSGASSR